MDPIIVGAACVWVWVDTLEIGGTCGIGYMSNDGNTCGTVTELARVEDMSLVLYRAPSKKYGTACGHLERFVMPTEQLRQYTVDSQKAMTEQVHRHRIIEELLIKAGEK